MESHSSTDASVPGLPAGGRRTVPFGGNLFVWLGLGLLTITILLAWGAWSNWERNQWVSHTLEMLRRLNRFETNVLEAEVLARANAVNRDAAWKAVETKMSAAELSLRRIRESSKDNPAQTNRAQTLASILAQLRGNLQFASTAADGQPADAFQPSVVLALIDGVNAMRLEEQTLLAERERASVQSVTVFWRITAVALALNLLFIWQASRASRRYMDERLSREAEITALNTQLARQVEETKRANESLAGHVREKTAELEQTVAHLRASKTELERFSYVASHHLQEPLRQVAGFIDLVLLRHGQALDDTARGYLANSVGGARRLQLMLRGLQEYTVLVSTVVRPREFSARTLAEAARDAVAQELQSAGGTLDLDVPEDLVLTGDQALLRRAVGILLSNAVRHRQPDAPPEIDLIIRREGRETVLSVTDNGAGIDPRFALRVFDMFGQLQTGALSQGAGTGLAIARKIVELHGGTIAVRPNAAGPGTTFQIILPPSPADQ